MPANLADCLHVLCCCPGYWAKDLSGDKVEQRYGTEEDLLELLSTAKAKGGWTK